MTTHHLDDIFQLLSFDYLVVFADGLLEIAVLLLIHGVFDNQADLWRVVWTVKRVGQLAVKIGKHDSKSPSTVKTRWRPFLPKNLLLVDDIWDLVQADLSENLNRLVEEIRLFTGGIRTARADMLQVLSNDLFHILCRDVPIL